jgi:hypothetical protein
VFDNFQARFGTVVEILVLAGFSLSIILIILGIDPLMYITIPEIFHAEIFVWILFGVITALFMGIMVLWYNQELASPSINNPVDPDRELPYRWEQDIMVIETYDRTLSRCIQALRQFEWSEIKEYNYDIGYFRAAVSVPSQYSGMVFSLVSFSIKKISDKKNRVHIITSSTTERIMSESVQVGTEWSVGSNVPGYVIWDSEIIRMHNRMKNFEVLETLVSFLKAPVDQNIPPQPLPGINNIDANGKPYHQDHIFPLDNTILSALFPGVGQTIAGRPGKGILLTIATATGLALYLIPGVIIWGYGIRDAYKSAVTVNSRAFPFKPCRNEIVLLHMIILGIAFPAGLYILIWLWRNHPLL